MLLKKQELLMCLYARGHENIMGFEEQQIEMSEQTRQRVKAVLSENKLLETDPRNEKGYCFSAYAQVLLDTIGKPDVWVDVRNLKTDLRRGLFLSDAFYVCVEEIGENVAVDLLPSLPIFIGGYASVLRDMPRDGAAAAPENDWEEDNQLAKVCVHGFGEELVMEIDYRGVTRETGTEGTAYTQHTQESCTNAVTMWLLNALKRKEGAQ